MDKNVEDFNKEGLGWRVSLSIIVAVGWLVFLVIWLFFYAENYSWEKNLSVILFSLLILAGFLGVPWMIWGMKHPKECEREKWATEGFKWRAILSAFLAVVLIVFLIIWFWEYATPYKWFQNLAIFIVTILIIGGLIGATWAPWGIKHGHRFEKKEEKKK